MPFSPSDFEWWVWLLFAVGAAVVSGVCGLFAAGAADADSKLGSIMAFLFGAVSFIAGLAGFGCFLLGIVRFAKWAWGG
jgi:hypothetical protein